MALCRISNRAKSDLRSIVETIFDHNAIAAKKWAKEVRATLDRLAAFPRLGKLRPDLPIDVVLRAFTKGRYVIFYQPKLHGIDVVRVVHASRDIQEIDFNVSYED